MDPYDAILELLKKAQTRGLETVTNRLDFVVESLEELIQGAKSSVQEAIPHEPEELFPVADIQAGIVDLRQQALVGEERARGLSAEIADLQQSIEEAQQRFEDAQQRLEEAQQRLEDAEQRLGAAERRPRGGVSLDLLRRLDRPRSQSELLRELLPLLSEHVGRAVVLVLRGTALSAWSGVGFADPERLRGWQGEVAGSEALERFVREAVPIRFSSGADPVFSRWLAGEPEPSEAMLVPVCLRGKVMGAVYLDLVDGRPWQPDEAQGLIALTCWLIDTLTYRQSVPSPMLAELVDLLGKVAEPELPAAAVEGEVFPAEEVEEEIAEEPLVEVLPAEDVEEAIAEEVIAEEPLVEVPPAEERAPVVAEPAPEPAPLEELALTAAPSFDASATMRVELREVPPSVELPPRLEPVPVAPVVEAPPPLRAFTAEEQAKHEEARRFARLLVSEIKLYNEEEVERGRTSRDLYHRLKEDIDRSKEMYEKRIPSEIRTARNYFYEELLRILADGDPDALGM